MCGGVGADTVRGRHTEGEWKCLMMFFMHMYEINQSINQSQHNVTLILLFPKRRHPVRLFIETKTHVLRYAVCTATVLWFLMWFMVVIINGSLLFPATGVSGWKHFTYFPQSSAGSSICSLRTLLFHQAQRLPPAVKKTKQKTKYFRSVLIYALWLYNQLVWI